MISEIEKIFPKRVDCGEIVDGLASDYFESETEDLKRLPDCVNDQEILNILSNNINAWFDITACGFLYLTYYVLTVLNRVGTAARGANVVSYYLISFRTEPPTCKLHLFNAAQISALFEVLKTLPNMDENDDFGGNDFFQELTYELFQKIWLSQRNM